MPRALSRICSPLAYLALVCFILAAHPVFGDIWSFQDDGGIIHFTNIEPSGHSAHRWRVAYRTGPGKAQTVSAAIGPSAGAGEHSSYPGCRVSRADVIPPKDRNPDRYTRYNAYIAEAATLYSLPEALIRAVIKAESDYDPNVVSCAGAKGLMQIMPYEEKSESIHDVFDPRDNIIGGGRLLRKHANRFQGDLVLTIAAHHAGEGAVHKYGGVPPYATTQAYVRAVLRHYQRYKENPGSPLQASRRPGRDQRLDLIPR